MSERRRSPRFRVTSEIEGRIKTTLKVRVVDLSKHGMRVESATGLPPNGICEITVLAPTGEKKLRAHVRRCRAQMVQANGGVSIVYHAGLEFEDGGEEGLDLADLMSEICTVECPTGDEKTEPVPEVEAQPQPQATGDEDDKGFKFAM
jgi:hypothetical protein